MFTTKVVTSDCRDEDRTLGNISLPKTADSFVHSETIFRFLKRCLSLYVTFKREIELNHGLVCNTVTFMCAACTLV